MSYGHIIIISTTSPTILDTDTIKIWIQPNVSQALIFINSWVPIASSNTISVYTEGIYNRTTYVQSDTPDGSIGDFWLKTTTKEFYIYLDGWEIVFGGAL